MNILITDDEAPARIRLRGLVEDLGHTVLAEASSGQQALQLCAELQPDTVLLDIRMPGMDGIELLRSVNSQWPQMAKVLMTAYGGQGIRESALNLCAEYIEKPFSPELLLKKMDRFQKLRGGNYVEKT